jgi:hypothetical protein
MEIKEFAFQEKDGGTYIEYLKQIERELSIKIGQPEIRDNKRRQDVIGMMLDITRDAIDTEAVPITGTEDIDILEVMAGETSHGNIVTINGEPAEEFELSDRTTPIDELIRRWPK